MLNFSARAAANLAGDDCTRDTAPAQSHPRGARRVMPWLNKKTSCAGGPQNRRLLSQARASRRAEKPKTRCLNRALPVASADTRAADLAAKIFWPCETCHC